MTGNMKNRWMGLAALLMTACVLFSACEGKYAKEKAAVSAKITTE